MSRNLAWCTWSAAVALCAVSGLLACRDAPSGAPVLAPSPKEAGAPPDGLLLAAVRAKDAARVPAVGYARVREGHVACGAVGLADAALGRRVERETLFPAASLAKPFVAAACLRAANEGRLLVEDDVSKLLPFSLRHPRFPDRAVTLKHLLTHTASLVDDWGELRRHSREGDPEEELRPYLVRSFGGKAAARRFAPDASSPGTTVRYANTGFALAALAVETAVAEPFEALVERWFFSPLRMRAAFRASRSGGELASPHVAGRDAGAFVPRPLLAHPVFPASDLRAEPCGLGRFLAALLGGGTYDGARVLDEESVRTLLAISEFPLGQKGALGFQVMRVGGAEVLGHEGEDDGASSVMALDVARRRAAVVLTNGDAFSSNDGSRAAALTELLRGMLED